MFPGRGRRRRRNLEPVHCGAVTTAGRCGVDLATARIDNAITEFLPDMARRETDQSYIIDPGGLAVQFEATFTGMVFSCESSGVFCR